MNGTVHVSDRTLADDGHHEITIKLRSDSATTVAVLAVNLTLESIAHGIVHVPKGFLTADLRPLTSGVPS